MAPTRAWKRRRKMEGGTVGPLADARKTRKQHFGSIWAYGWCTALLQGYDTFTVIQIGVIIYANAIFFKPMLLNKKRIPRFR